MVPVIHVRNDFHYDFTVSFPYLIGSILRGVRYFLPTPLDFSISSGTPFAGGH